MTAQVKIGAEPGQWQLPITPSCLGGRPVTERLPGFSASKPYLLKTGQRVPRLGVGVGVHSRLGPCFWLELGC